MKPTLENRNATEPHSRSPRAGQAPTGSDSDPIIIEEPRAPSRPTHGLDGVTIVAFPARVFLALGWTRAGVEKLISADWWRGEELEAFLRDQHGHALSFMRPVIDTVFMPGAMIIAALVVLVQLAMGIALAVGKRHHLLVAVGAGIALNLTFVSLGVVNPSAFYLVMGLMLLTALGDRTAAAVSVRRRAWRALACAGSALAMVPFAGTVHPEHVIHDPALMLATFALLCASIDVLRIGQVFLDEPLREQPKTVAEQPLS